MIKLVYFIFAVFAAEPLHLNRAKVFEVRFFDVFCPNPLYAPRPAKHVFIKDGKNSADVVSLAKIKPNLSLVCTLRGKTDWDLLKSGSVFTARHANVWVTKNGITVVGLKNNFIYIHYGDSDAIANILRWRITSIVKYWPKSYCTPFRSVEYACSKRVNPEFRNGQVSSGLRFANLRGFSGHFLGGNKGAPNIENTNSRYESHKRTDYEHSERPKRHFSLSYKVFLGAFVLIAGLYYINHAFRFSSVLREGEALFYLFLGMAGVGVGVGAILAYGFAVFPP